jgi:hypothetical protein
LAIAISLAARARLKISCVDPVIGRPSGSADGSALRRVDRRCPSALADIQIFFARHVGLGRVKQSVVDRDDAITYLPTDC